MTLEDDDVDGPLNQLLPKAKKETPDRIGTSYICTDVAAGIGSKVLFEEASVVSQFIDTVLSRFSERVLCSG